ncbi:TPA: terminase large subunit domain-containing protein, partial [Proteus mirabilis]
MKKIEITVELLNDICEKYSRALFEWQKNWKNNQFHRNRILHKGRQVGADWYFSLEALHDAMLTGRNKLFLGEMSEGALGYFCGHLNIKHNEVGFFELSNGAQISFIRELETTFSGRFGDVYISEWAWLE